MTIEAGLWIDHRKSVIVLLQDGQEHVLQISSNVENLVGSSLAPHSKPQYMRAGAREDIEDRRFIDHLDKYYHEVLSQLQNADSILLFGPGEAKRELRKCLEHHQLGKRLAQIETVGKMTNRQIAAKVRRFFQN
jgi:stalled ribosome rescue protein Dom34